MKVYSMTGFSSVEGDLGESRFRFEIKALNHRFLDLKIRLPREFSSAELPLRSYLQSALGRGVVEVKLERVSSSTEVSVPEIQTNLGLAAHYFETLRTIQKAFGLADTIRTVDIASFPEVITKGSQEFPVEEAWKKLEPLAKQSVEKLREMRLHEGQSLARVLTDALAELGNTLDRLRARRAECESIYKSKVRERVSAVFQEFPISGAGVQDVLETRIAQELAILLDRTDVEEELTRFQGHLDHFRKILAEGGAVGRKLDFLLQELNRETNTLGNKAQDLQISEDVIAIKVRVEQLREQVMNLE